MANTNKKTNMVFETKQAKNDAVDTLLSMNVKFTASVKYPVLSVSPSVYLRKYLDLYLPEHIAASSFTQKP